MLASYSHIDRYQSLLNSLIQDRDIEGV